MPNSLRIAYAGTPEFAVPALRALFDDPAVEIVCVYTQPDRPAGRGKKLRFSPVKRLALDYVCSVRQPENINAREVVEELRSDQIDLMVVAAYGQLLKATLLDLPKFGCINIHASLLPRWRGAAPIQSAILNNDTETGITIMQMDETLDGGDMLLQKSVEILPSDSSEDLHDKLAEMGAVAICQAVKQISVGESRARPQDDSLATYAPKIKKSDARLNWSETSETLATKVRAYKPWPVAYTSLEGKGVRIYEAQSIAESHGEEPGKVIREDKTGIYVAASEGLLRIDSLQVEGAKRMKVSDFLNARSLLGRCFEAE